MLTKITRSRRRSGNNPTNQTLRTFTAPKCATAKPHFRSRSAKLDVITKTEPQEMSSEKDLTALLSVEQVTRNLVARLIWREKN